MRYSIAALAKRKVKMRRKSTIVSDIPPPTTLATDLYQAAYRPAVDLWQKALPNVMSEYERQLARMTVDEAADAVGQVETELERLFLLIRPVVDQMAIRIERWQRGKWRGALLSATGVDVDTLIGPDDVRDTMSVWVDRNVSLIKDVSAQARQRISDAVFRGLTERRPATEVAKQIREAVGMGRARSRRIASDQLVKITSSLADERRREAGIDKWKWRSSGKLHPRADHVSRNGKVYSDVTGAGGLSPPDDRPGQLPFCGCRAQAVIEFD